MLSKLQICPLTCPYALTKSLVGEEVFLLLYVLGMTFEEIKQVLFSDKTIIIDIALA